MGKVKPTSCSKLLELEQDLEYPKFVGVCVRRFWEKLSQKFETTTNLPFNVASINRKIIYLWINDYLDEQKTWDKPICFVFRINCDVYATLYLHDSTEVSVFHILCNKICFFYPKICKIADNKINAIFFVYFQVNV